MHKPSPESQRVFARNIGAKVAICGRTAEKLESAAAQLMEIAGTDKVLAATCDIREPSQVEAFVQDLIGDWGHIDILVNNAGGQFPSPAQHITPNGFLAVVRNNLGGTF